MKLDAARFYADAIGKLLSNGMYTAVTCHEQQNFRPEIRSGQVLESCSAFEYEHAKGTGAAKIYDSYGVYGINADAKVTINADKQIIYVEQVSGSGDKLVWGFAPEGEMAVDKWRLWQDLMEQSWKIEKV